MIIFVAIVILFFPIIISSPHHTTPHHHHHHHPIFGIHTKRYKTHPEHENETDYKSITNRLHDKTVAETRWYNHSALYSMKKSTWYVKLSVIMKRNMIRPSQQGSIGIGDNKRGFCTMSGRVVIDFYLHKDGSDIEINAKHFAPQDVTERNLLRTMQSERFPNHLSLM